MGFEQLFDNLTFKCMAALKKQIQFLVDYVLSHCFWTYAMFSKFWKYRKDLITLEVYLVCSDINDRYDIRQASFTPVFEVFCITGNLVVSGFSYCISSIFENSQLSEFSNDLQDYGL